MDDLKHSSSLEFFQADTTMNLPLPCAEVEVQAGFPSPAADSLHKRLDLNEYLIRHPAATFIIRVKGESMIEAGIHDQDLLIVDRSLEPHNGSIVIAAVDGELTVKKFKLDSGKYRLYPCNEAFPVIDIPEGSELVVWGVVAYVIHAL